MLVRVSQEHIDEGRRHHSSENPISLAITATLPGADRIYSGGAVVKVLYRGLLHWYDLDEHTARIIRHYDLGGHMTPFEFNLPCENLWL